MHEQCHRCGGELPTGNETGPFCPHCGAPQLVLQEYDRPATDTVAADSTGTAPPPSPRQIEWQTALRCAALVAAIAAVLNVIALPVPAVSLLSTFWLLSGSMISLSLYQRSRPLAWMDARVGARIGFTTGILLVIAVVAASAAAGLVARFGLHHMARFDADMAETFAAARKSSQAASTPLPPEWLHIFDQPEFRASMMLFGVAMASTFLLILSTLGGALGGMLRTRRRVSS